MRYNDRDLLDVFKKQWDLVCDRKWMVLASMAAYTCGSIVGILASGILSDR